MYKDVVQGGLTTFPSASVGYENVDGTEGLQCTYNGSGPIEPVTGMGIRLYPRCITAPPPVDDLMITLTSGTDVDHVVLSWTSTGAAQYHIYKSDDPYTGFTEIGTTTGTQYTDTGAVVDSDIGFYYVTSDNETLDFGPVSGGTFPPENLRHLFQPTHVEAPSRK